MKLSKSSIVLLVIQLALVSSIAAKYFYQRAACPSGLDAGGGIRSEPDNARPLFEPAANCRRLPEYAALRAARHFSAQRRRHDEADRLHRQR